ncbi:hypothetical protein WSM22_17220 [Cytophagales bacterium WSM2-2]|nr:hypothetical protein WSM22_17220 [Cytophagales bacterium WSM2-2]
MSYTIVRITNLYSGYLAQYQLTFPYFQQKSYKEQYEHLISDSFDSDSSISRALNKIGVNSIVLFNNAPWLQDRWKAENNCVKSGKELIFEQLKSIKPDVVWIDNPAFVDRQWISSVRENIKSVKAITGLVCSPYSSNDLRTLKLFDFLTTCTPCLDREFKDLGIKSYLIYHSFDPEILDKIKSRDEHASSELLFIGSLYTGGGFHKTRIEYLEEFLKSGLSVEICGSIDPTAKLLTKKSAYYLINMVKGLGGGSLIKDIPILKRYEQYGDTPINFYSRKLKSSISPPVFGLKQFRKVSKANICFNIHGEIAKNCAGNLRLFEATGVGSCLITDWKENLSELFDIEREVITYKSIPECIDKIQWLMKNPSERLKIARAGQQRTLKDHTTMNRATKVDQIIKDHL